MLIQLFTAIFCIIMIIVYRDSFAEKELVTLRREIAELRRQRNRHLKSSIEWRELHKQLKEKEQEYKSSLGVDNLRW